MQKKQSKKIPYFTIDLSNQPKPDFFKTEQNITDKEAQEFLQINDFSTQRSIVRRDGIDLFELAVGNAFYLNGASSKANVKKSINKSLFNLDAQNNNLRNKQRNQFIEQQDNKQKRQYMKLI
jgi:hypothetical protein